MLLQKLDQVAAFFCTYQRKNFLSSACGKKKKCSFLYFPLAWWFSLGLQAIVGYPSTFCFQQVGGQIHLGTPAGLWELGEAGAGQGGEPFPGAGEQDWAVLGQEYPCSHPCSNSW